MTETPAPPAHAPAIALVEPEAAPANQQTPESPRLRVPLFDRMDGTWYRPAPFSKASACIEFWNTVQIPDGAIEQFERAYNAAVAADKTREHDEVMTPWGEAWMKEHPKPRRDKDRPEWQAQFDAAFKTRADALDAEIAPKYPDLTFFDLPQLLRALKMLQNRPGGEHWEQGELVLDEWIELYEETLTVGQIEDRYHLSRLLDSLHATAVPSAFAAVVSAVADLDRTVAALHNEVYSARLTLLDIHHAMD